VISVKGRTCSALMLSRNLRMVPGPVWATRSKCGELISKHSLPVVRQSNSGTAKNTRNPQDFVQMNSLSDNMLIASAIFLNFVDGCGARFWHPTCSGCTVSYVLWITPATVRLRSGCGQP
jgi:hypothetical protein